MLKNTLILGFGFGFAFSRDMGKHTWGLGA